MLSLSFAFPFSSRAGRPSHAVALLKSYIRFLYRLACIGSQLKPDNTHLRRCCRKQVFSTHSNTGCTSKNYAHHTCVQTTIQLHLKTRDDIHITKSCHSRLVAHLYGTVYRCKHTALTPPPGRAPGGNSNRTHTHFSRDTVCLLNTWAMTVGVSHLNAL